MRIWEFTGQDVSGNLGAPTPVYYLRFIQIVSKGRTVEN